MTTKNALRSSSSIKQNIDFVFMGEPAARPKKKKALKPNNIQFDMDDILAKSPSYGCTTHKN